MSDPQLPPSEPRGARDDLSLAPLPPGETLEPQYVRREPEEDVDLSGVGLTPTGRSRAEAELEADPAKAARLAKLREQAEAPPPPPAPPEPWLQFTIRDLLLVSGAIAVGLGAGRLETTGFLVFFLGWAVVIVSGYVLVSETKLHFWKVLMFSLLAAYLGGILSVVLRVLRVSGDAPLSP